MDYLSDLIHAHRKLLIAAIAGVLALVLDAETAKEVAGAIGVILVGVIPNDGAASDRIYRGHRRR